MLIAAAKGLCVLVLGLIFIVMGWEALGARPDTLANLGSSSSFAATLWGIIGPGWLALLLLFMVVAAALGVSRNIEPERPKKKEWA